MLNGVRVVAVRDVAAIAHSVSRKMRDVAAIAHNVGRKMRDVAAIAHSVGRKMHRFRLRSATMSDVAKNIWPAEIAFSKIKQENNDHKSKNIA